ncbi:class I adenylate-forming enzyme family protein [Catellatospora sp. KI3]|uniref:class I adenylate-forming enzyme family protein n=1 Tax=Catellatospora sp. KI3 TaxID=3041620 RepID=UPI002482889B|nr:class I adenylate-forming enzyme family protein [Catellatospora sp. KI3]MDI1463877.1 class I adenylate-forming enzyme family protein [Catellatospora sp. KI3]
MREATVAGAPPDPALLRGVLPEAVLTDPDDDPARRLAAVLDRSGGTADGLLRHAARTAPGRAAIKSGQRTVSFAALDAAADNFAAALLELLPTGHGAAALGGASMVGVAAALDPAFAVAYYGTVRAGHVCAVVNPLQGADELHWVLESADVRVLVAVADMADRLRAIRLDLPNLRHVVYLDRPGEGGLFTLAGMSRRHRGTPAPEHRADPDAVAVAQFTSGTTGRPKAVLLTHRNVVYNAAQVALAHGLGATTVGLNHLPTYHPMHLNSAVCAGSTQVLVPAGDPAEAVSLARTTGATHFYSLPVRLARMAGDPRLPGWQLPTARAVLSGGSALSPSAAARLSAALGVPVIQGYGLAETSPLTHCDRIDAPRPGSVGRPVPGTGCRVVDLDTRQPLPPGQPGEVQVSGPQVMAGYLAADGSVQRPVDADGWFDTGDVGYLDTDGALFLVDRLKDVFKCDNWLVSPVEVERTVARHPAVVDCMVVDLPHPERGAVAYALVVTDDEDVTGDDVIAFVNGQLPDYQHLHGIELVREIPRSATGKVRRRDIRTQLHGRLSAAHSKTV